MYFHFISELVASGLVLDACAAPDQACPNNIMCEEVHQYPSEQSVNVAASDVFSCCLEGAGFP